MPDNIVSFDRAKRKQKASVDQELYTLLARIDDLESALELMEELGLETRADVAALIKQLEQEAESHDSDH